MTPITHSARLILAVMMPRTFVVKGPRRSAFFDLVEQHRITATLPGADDDLCAARSPPSGRPIFPAWA
jgi:hypothetical protein